MKKNLLIIISGLICCTVAYASFLGINPNNIKNAHNSAVELINENGHSTKTTLKSKQIALKELGQNYQEI